MAVGWTLTAVYDGPCTDSDVDPDDPAKLASPEYTPVTVPLPTGALLAEQEPSPPLRDATHTAVVPTVKVTVPVGIPDPISGWTLAENVTLCPAGTGEGLTPTVIEVAAGGAPGPTRIKPSPRLLPGTTAKHVLGEGQLRPETESPDEGSV